MAVSYSWDTQHDFVQQTCSPNPEVKIHGRTHISQQDTEVTEHSLILVQLPATDNTVTDSNRRQATDTLDHRKVTPTAVTQGDDLNIDPENKIPITRITRQSTTRAVTAEGRQQQKQ